MNTPNTTRSQSAFRRLLVLGAIVMGFVIYAYGWEITDISLEETQEPSRQSSVQRALRELLSPNLFDQQVEAVVAPANLQLECTDAEVPSVPREEGEPYVTLTPPCGVRGDTIRVEGFNFPADTLGRIFLTRPSGERQPINLPNTPAQNSFDIDGSGHFVVDITVPTLRGGAGDIHQLQIESLAPVGLPYFSPTTNLVIEKMVETIFLALMATTLALPIAAVLSFLAARNLMKEIHLPLGVVMVALILLPVGWILAELLLAPIGRYGVTLGKELFMGIVGPVVAISGFGFAARLSNDLKNNQTTAHLYQIITNVLLLAVVIFTLGAVGGIGIWLGTQLTEGIPGYIGNFVGTLGQLIEIIITPLSALAGALLVSSVGTNLLKSPLRSLEGILSHISGGVLGAISGGLLMAGVAVIGSSAALFTVLPPLVLALLFGQLVALIYPLLVPSNTVPGARTPYPGIRAAISFAATAVGFVIAAHTLNTLHFVVTGRTPPPDFISAAALIGAVLGSINGLLSGVHMAFPLGDVVYNTTRTILNTLRSIEPLIMGIVFVIWVSIGPFAGVLALTLHSIASLGKLYSEQIESIDEGPLEAIQSTGATQLQTIIYAVVPQIIPPYIAFTMYRWDINVRMSTIIGFVGGGGIGFLLQQQINLLRYREAGVAVLAIAIVVSVLDYASAKLREHIG